MRLGPQGVKAKYVRIELRKIETLPGGAQNSFYDFVGQSPIQLWQSSEEYGMLHSVSSPCFLFNPLPLSFLTSSIARHSFLHPNT